MIWIYPNTQLIAFIAAIRTLFATAEMHLIKSAVAISKTTVIGDLTAAEADFDGYAAITLAAVGATFPDPIRGGVSFIVPTQSWVVGAAPVVGNDIHGGWFESGAGALLLAWTIEDPVSMQAGGNTLALETLLNWFGNEPTNDVVMSINNTPI